MRRRQWPRGHVCTLSRTHPIRALSWCWVRVAMWWPSAQNDRERQQLRALAAIGGAGVWLSAAVVLLLTAAACGAERPPWTGFELFPPDAGGIELSPPLEASLQAAEAAFLAQLAAGQGGGTAGASAASANAAGA